MARATRNATNGGHISPPIKPKVPKSVRVPDGMNKQTIDSLQNLITGLGTDKDKSTSTVFTVIDLNRAQVENAYRSDWIARKIVTIPAQDCTREWRSWMSDNKDIETIEDLERDLAIQRKVYEVMWRARLYGGAGLLLGVNDGHRIEDELDIEKVGKDDLKFVHVLSKWDLAAGPIEWSIDSPYYGVPQYYTRSMGTGERIHPSRVIRFIGNEMPDINVANGWGDSVLQAVHDAVLAAGIVSASGSQLLQEAKMDVIHIPDLAAALASTKSSERLLARFGAANVAKSLYNILLLDKEEDWERIETNMAGMPDILKMYLLIASGAADIPATRFLSQSPQGLNATGESDIRNHYDMIKSKQNNEVAPALNVLDEIIVRSALGTFTPGDIVYEWRPLWQQDEKTKAETAKSKSDTWKTDLESGVIPQQIMRDARLNQLIEDGTYPGLEQILEEFGPLEDIDEEEEEEIPVNLIGPNGEPLEPVPDPANENQLPRNNAEAVRDMVDRLRKKRKKKLLYTDATPRTLYVRRDVINKAELMAWARKANLKQFGDVVDDLHVTIMYSRTPVDWAKAPAEWSQYFDNKKGELLVRPGGMRMLDKLGLGGSVVSLLFTCAELAYRHCAIKDTLGCSWDWDYYQPHITFAYGDPAQSIDFDALRAIEPYRGKILFGPEIWEETTDGY